MIPCCSSNSIGDEIGFKEKTAVTGGVRGEERGAYKQDGEGKGVEAVRSERLSWIFRQTYADPG